jgi:hypothetical protein
MLLHRLRCIAIYTVCWRYWWKYLRSTSMKLYVYLATRSITNSEFAKKAYVCMCVCAGTDYIFPVFLLVRSVFIIISINFFL